MKFKYYRMPIIDLKLREVRLVETDHKGNYLYDEKGKKIKSNISVVYFGEHLQAVIPMY